MLVCMCNSKAVQADNAEEKAIAAKVPPFWREAKEDKRGRKGKLQVRVAQKQKKSCDSDSNRADTG